MSLLFLLILQLLILPETFADIGNAAERRAVRECEVVYAFSAGGAVFRSASIYAHLIAPKIGPTVYQPVGSGPSCSA